ncbi:MAG: putative toxin-antitoxin system toxin component, PIN family [Candidatus Omnitrophica bacterium]|nr:putative toxin-antitoxin system toxin component, PIN family [Candidatus Omnitrophota bacterium]
MRIVADTNVIFSGIFFGGIPGAIINAWRRDNIEFILSDEILDEYSEVGYRMIETPAFEDYLIFLRLLLNRSPLVTPSTLSGQICSDPDDDKFIACALGGKGKVIVSGDKALLECSGYQGIEILSPRDFVDKYLA